MACQPADPPGAAKKLDEIDKRLANIERMIQQGAGRGAGMQQPQRPQGPDPAKAYAVPIAGAPYVGPEHAKVTIVEAFEFA